MVTNQFLLFSSDLKVARESLSTDKGREFHQDGAALLLKTPLLVNDVLLNGVCRCGMDDERSDHVLLGVTMCRLRYASVDVRPTLNVSTTCSYGMPCSTGNQCSSSSSGMASDRLGDCGA